MPSQSLCTVQYCFVSRYQSTHSLRTSERHGRSRECWYHTYKSHERVLLAWSESSLDTSLSRNWVALLLLDPTHGPPQHTLQHRSRCLGIALICRCARRVPCSPGSCVRDASFAGLSASVGMVPCC
eukprot:2907878-Rhodomonas_salina.1